MRVLVTGATGFVGRSLVKRLERPVVLSRNPERAQKQLGEVDAFAWSGAGHEPPQKAFEGVETVIHLAGEPIADGRWTAARKARIRDSRIEGTRSLVRTLSQLSQRPHVLVSGSAVGYYGSRGDEILTEFSPGADDFLAQLCRDWEREALAAEKLGIRVVCLRTGIVLGPKGGALAKMLPPFRFGLGGPLGNGRQWMPWIHLEDEVDLALFAAQNENVSGPMNGVAPQPETNREFTRILAALLGRPAFLPVPEFALRIVLGEFAKVLFASQRVAPQVALDAGYKFRYPDLTSALKACLGIAAKA